MIRSLAVQQATTIMERFKSDDVKTVLLVGGAVTAVVNAAVEVGLPAEARGEQRPEPRVDGVEPVDRSRRGEDRGGRGLQGSSSASRR